MFIVKKIINVLSFVNKYSNFIIFNHIPNLKISLFFVNDYSTTFDIIIYSTLIIS